MRRKKFTPAVMEQISRLVVEGKTPQEIAQAVGCKVSTLRVRCSQFKISLRSAPKPKIDKLAISTSQFSVWLSPVALENLRRQAMSAKTPASKLAAALLEAAVADDLYKAILDNK